MVYLPSCVPFPTVDTGAGDAVTGDAVTGDAVEDGDVGIAEDPALAADEAAPVFGGDRSGLAGRGGGTADRQPGRGQGDGECSQPGEPAPDRIGETSEITVP
jgi:hypothetical protein